MPVPDHRRLPADRLPPARIVKGAAVPPARPAATPSPAPPPSRSRTIRDVDREIASSRSDRARLLMQIEDHLKGVAALRARYARLGGHIDDLLDERLGLPS